MTPEIEMFSKNYISPEQKDLVDRFFILVEDFDIANIDIEINDLLSNELNISSEDRTLGFFNICINGLKGIVKNHGIVLSDDNLTTENIFSFLIDLSESLYNIPFYEDKVTINRVLEGTECNEEKLSEILSLVSHKEDIYFLQHLEDVPNYLLNKIKEVSKETDTSIGLEYSEFNVKAINKCKRIREIFGSDFKSFSIISTGLIFGDTIDNYLKRFYNEVETDNVDKLAKELFILSSISSDGFNNPLMAIRKSISNYITDLNIQTRLDNLLNKTIMQYDNAHPNMKDYI